MSRKPTIISIAAISGGGKTTITNELKKRFDNSKALYFDDYEFEESPADICKWVEDGSDYNEWNLEPLVTDIQSVLEDDTIEYIFLDYPFAYLNSGVAEYIDFAIYIDTPLDIAMARRIIRDFSDSSIMDIQRDLSHYLLSGRSAYLEMEKSVKPNSDIILDGTLSKEIIVEQIITELQKKRRNQ
ncbi:hypothetical protein K0H71_16615 [Bacillus sp. IITD106]|nr:hypothetical protein [Bacillus sp. IITD106]